MKNAYCILLVFLVLFNFKVPLIQYSAVVALLLASTTYALKPSYTTVLLTLFRKKYILAIWLGLIAIICLLPVSPILHQTYDFTIIKPFVLEFVLVTIAIYILPILIVNAEGDTFLYFLKLVITVFFVQSLIEVFAFALPPFAAVVHYFQKSEVADMNMGGLRALALTGNPFFSLSAGFGLMYIFLFKYFLEKQARVLNWKNIMVLLVSIIGTFFAGRTGFVGLLFAIAFYIAHWRGFYFKTVSVFKMLGIVTIAVAALLLVLPPAVNEMIFDKLLPFAFEFVYKYLEGSGVSTTSTDALSEMYFPISIQTFFTGDGKYTEGTGYYMSTDAGYMRQVLFFGVFGALALFMYQMCYFLTPFFCALNRPTLRQRYNDLLFLFFILAYLLTTHYKGEVIGFLPEVQVMLIIVLGGYITSYYYKP
ncbi:MAG TPA: hypothetical protein VGE79_14480, partial [Niastella sp.]